MTGALFFAALVAVIRGLYFLAISNPAELLDNNIEPPIVGVIPKADLDDSNERLKNLTQPEIADRLKKFSDLGNFSIV